MSIITPENVFLLFIGIVFSGFLLVPYILLMHLLMPSAILDTYFKPPYFREFECRLFTGIPYAPMRTIMFMGVFAYPQLGKKRKLTEAHRLVPNWYRVASKLFIYYLVLIALGMVTTLGGLLIYNVLTSP